MKRFALAAAVLAALPAAAWAQGPATGFPFGVWQNPKDSVHIEIRPCGASACGYVVWATPKAQADSERAGTPKLVGSELFRDFKPLGEDVWQGKVFVPDLRMTFSGTARPSDGGFLRARGCLISNYICKTQIWRRIADKAE